MRIGINASFARKPDSGIGQVTLNFLRQLNQLETGDLEFVLYLEQELPKDLVLGKKFKKEIFLPMLYRRDDLIRKVRWEKKVLPKRAKRDGCDVLLSLYQSATVTKDLKHIMLVHDVVWKIFPKYLNNSRKKIYYKAVERAIGKADGIVTISENSKKDIVRLCKIPEQKIKTLHIDCDPIFKKDVSSKDVEKVVKKYKVSTNYQLPTTNYIFYIGGFDVRKNVRNLIEGYALMWKRHHGEVKIPDLVLGGGFNPKLVPVVTDLPQTIGYVKEKYGLPEKKIKQIGFVQQKDLPALYRGAELFCYPSLYEGFGIPVLEAMNCECPVITSRVSSIPEIASDKEVLFVDPRQSEDVAVAMHKMLTDEQLREKLVGNAKKRAEKFSWEIFTENIIKQITETSK